MFDFDNCDIEDTSLVSTYNEALLQNMSGLLHELAYTFNPEQCELYVFELHNFLKRVYDTRFPLYKELVIKARNNRNHIIPAQFIHNAQHKFFKMHSEEYYVARCDLDVDLFLFHIKYIIPVLDKNILHNDKKLVCIPTTSTCCPTWLNDITFYSMTCDVSLWEYNPDVVEVRFNELLQGSDIRNILNTALEYIGPDAQINYVFFRLLCGNRLFGNPDAVKISQEIVKYIKDIQHIDLNKERWYEHTLPVQCVIDLFEQLKFI